MFPCHKDNAGGSEEDDLYQDPRQKGFDRASGDAEALASGIRIGGKDRQQHQEKSQRGIRRCRSHHQADSSEKFQDACDRDEEVRSRKRRRHHGHQIGTPFAPVRGSGQQEHARQRQAERCQPVKFHGKLKVTENAKQPNNTIKTMKGTIQFPPSMDRASRSSIAVSAWGLSKTIPVPRWQVANKVAGKAR